MTELAGSADLVGGARSRLHRGENDRPAVTTSLNGKQGTELADVIVGKIKQAVNAITYR